MRKKFNCEGLTELEKKKFKEFIQNPEIQKIIKKDFSQYYVKLFLIILVFIFTAIYIRFFELENNISKIKNFGDYIELFFLFLVLFAFFYFLMFITQVFFFHKFFTINLKKDLFHKLMLIFDQNLNFDPSNKYFSDELKVLQKDLKIIPDFNIVKYEGDSIKYLLTNKDNNQSEKSKIIINGKRIKTRLKENGGGSNQVTSKKYYLIRAKYLPTISSIKIGITLKKDFSKNIFNVIGPYVIISVFSSIFSILILFLKPFIIHSKDEILYIANLLNIKPIYIGIIFLVIGYVITGIICFIFLFYINNMINGKRIKITNKNIEKKFDIYCNDNKYFTEIFDNSLQEKLLVFLENINKKKGLEMFLYKNLVYFKFKNQTIDHILIRNPIKKINDYIKFYVDIKNIIKFISDLETIFYKKT